MNGTIAGYDPGGDGKHAFAILSVRDGKPGSILTKTLFNAQSVIDELLAQEILAVGVDTLTCWCTGSCGWRPADHWLKASYPKAQLSVASQNSLYGAMAVNGMSVLIEARKQVPELIVSETHPKVLYYALTGKKYDFKTTSPDMKGFLSQVLDGIACDISNDHEWDAAVSTYAMMMGLSGGWTSDLHQLPAEGYCQTLHPCGPTHYFWPDD